MATASNADEGINCSICKTQCIGPRKLPECEHICCATCILIYITKLKDNGEHDIGFSCPTCEVVNPGPKDVQAAIAWIKSLERAPISISDGKQKQSQKSCKSCEVLGRTSEAVKFCLECHETLCQSCSDVRHTHKLLKNHKVEDVVLCHDKIREEDRLFDLICALVLCDIHSGNPITFFCNDHEEFGCESCVDLDHEKCSDVVKAYAHVDKECLMTEMDMARASAKNLGTYAKSITDKLNANTEGNKNQVESLKADLKAIRSNINALFDYLEVKTLKQTQFKTKKWTSKAQKDIQELEQMMSSCTSSLALLDRFMSFDCLTQSNIILPKIKQRMKADEERILEMSETFKTFTLKYKQENMLARLLNLGYNNTQELFTVTEEEDAKSIDPFQGFLLLKQYQIQKVREISTKEAYNKDSPWYAMVKFLCDNTIVLFDTDLTCIRIKADDKVLPPCKVSAQQPNTDKLSSNLPVPLDGKKVEAIAVPHPSLKLILILSVGETIAVKREIDTKYKPKALHVLKNGDIAVAWNSPVAFGIISVGDVFVETKVYFQNDKSGRRLKSFDFITVDERRSHVIQPCSSSDSVYCFDFEGQTKFTYQVGSFSPGGVALDGDGNIYICSYFSAIHIISPSGCRLHTISTDNRGLIKPLAIAVSKNGEEFVVTQGENRHVINILKLRKKIQ